MTLQYLQYLVEVLLCQRKIVNYHIFLTMKRKPKRDCDGVKFQQNFVGQFDFDDDLEVKISKHHRVPKGLITCARNSCAYLSFLLIGKSSIRIQGDDLPPNEWKGIMEIIHVFVPEASRGLKVAERLARKAFSVAKDNEWVVRASCSYIRDTFLIRCPEYVEQTLHEEIQDVRDNGISVMSADTTTNSKRNRKSSRLEGPDKVDLS